MSCVVIADFYIKEGKGQEFSNWANKDIFPGTRTYDGNVSIEAYTNLDDEDQITFYEEWESRQHHEVYIEFRKTDGTMEYIEKMSASAPSIRYFE
tara:strand:+ start:98 stop:382 length:285 start_codon:yes stop_codon:yes gene_type:complete